MSHPTISQQVDNPAVTIDKLFDHPNIGVTLPDHIEPVDRVTPPHQFLDDAPYFVTGGIDRGRPLLRAEEVKIYLLKWLKKIFAEYGWKLYHWVILDNHYHLLGKSLTGADLPEIFSSIHSETGLFIHRLTGCQKPVWQNYWSYCPRNERDYMIRRNYLLMDPVNHGYGLDLHAYPFSSFHDLLAKEGREELLLQFRAYPEYKQLVLHEANGDDF